MRLIIASDAQKFERDALTHSAWGQRLTLDQYGEREARLRGHPWARDAMTTWLWVDADRVLASCETFRMESRLGDRPGHTYAVASVFTEAALRGQGHATAMMRALVARLPEEDPQAQASVLYSDVGAEIYARAGYQPTRQPDRLVEAAPGDPAATVDAVLQDGEVAAALDRAPWPSARFLVRPTGGQIDWHAERERAYADLLRRPRPALRGARVGRELILWYADAKADRLEVLLVLAERPEGVAALVESARRHAAALGLTAVRLWASPADPPWPPGLGREVPREGSLPMLAPLVPDLGAEHWSWIPRALWV